MTLNMEATGSGEFSTKRNKAIIHALCNRFSLNQENILSDISGSLDITNLVAYFFQSSGNDISISDNQIEVMKWATFASNISENKDACHASLKDLNEHLTLKSVLLGGLKTSVADVIVFSALHDFVSHLTNEDAQKYPNVMRWADYIQNKEDFDGAFDLIAINKLPFGHFQSTGLKDANQTAKNIVESSKGANKSVRDTNSVNDLREAAANDKVSINSKNGSKGNNVNASLEQTKKSTEEKKKPSDKELSEKDTECPITLLNMQVGLILKAWKHPSADSLLVEEIDLGDNNQRQVVSGLAKYYSPDDLIGRHVVLITNVKPGKLRDVMSSGLVLCASNQELSTVEPIIPPEGAKVGERISFSGFEGKPEDVLNPKKKQLEKITPHLYTDEVGVPRYRGLLFMTSVGPCTSSIPNGAIK